ncbi:PorA family protein [Actinophytocola sediminis]
MRRILSFILLGLGVFAVALGLLLRFYAYPQLAKVPLDQESTSVSEGSGITALVVQTVDGAPSPEIRQNLNLTSTTYVTGDLTAPEVEEGGDVAVYVEAIRTVDDASGIVVNATVRSLCVDRFTNEAVVPCEGQYVEQEQGNRQTADRNTLQQPGQSFKFPFGAEERDYQYFDLTVGESIDARFQGTEEIQGLPVNRYVMDVPATKVADREVPGSLIGEQAPSVTAELFYQVRRTVWVEPETGIVIRGAQDMKQELVTAGDAPGDGTTVFEGTLGFNETTVNDNVTKAEDTMSKLSMLTSWPVYMWVGGGVLIVAGALLLLTANSGGRRGRGADARTLRRTPAHAEN